MCLTQYNPTVRSKVPSLDEAHKAYKKVMAGKNKDDFLFQFQDVFKKHGLVKDFGLHLSHRHNDHGEVILYTHYNTLKSIISGVL